MKQNIEGIKITPLKIISDNRGSVMHMLRSDSDVFQKFGEIYFSTIFKFILNQLISIFKNTLI